MRRLLSLTLSFAVGFPWLVALSAAPARAQQVASVGNIDALRQQYEQMLAVERNASTPPEVRDLNRTFLEERRAQLAAAIRHRIGALNKYRAAVISTLSDEEKRALDGSATRLSAELQALLPEAVPAAAPVVEASFEASAPADAEPAAADPGRAAAPIEIVSPARDRVVHTSEVELEVNVRDEGIDDLMVAVYTPASEKPKTARVLGVKRSDRGAKSIVVALSQGGNRVEVSDLKRGEVKAERHITFQPPETTALGAAPAAAQSPTPTPETQQQGADRLLAGVIRNESNEYDWGRLRGYFTGGVIFSKSNEEFSKSDMALSFVLDKNYRRSSRWNINTFFEARMTAVPVTTATPEPDTDAETPAGGGNTVKAAAQEAPKSETDTFIESRKAAFAQVGVYVPINVNHWVHDRNMNSLFIAPLAKGGIQTIEADRETSDAGRKLSNDDVYNFFAVGARFGHYRYPRPARPCGAVNGDDYARFLRARNTNESLRKAARKLLNDDAKRKELNAILTNGKTDDEQLTAVKELLNETAKGEETTGWGDWDYDQRRECDEPWDYAPELVSWLDLTTGRWENFEVPRTTMQGGQEVTTLRRPWRYQAEGRLKIPGGPFLVGFDGNFGEGKDDVRFGFGMRFDVGNLIAKLKAIESFKALDRASGQQGGGTQE